MTDNPLFTQTVRTIRSLKAKQTGLIIPAGTAGKVLAYDQYTGRLVIDFGIANHAQAIDLRSRAIEAVEAVVDG